jgi:hypothetical protein
MSVALGSVLMVLATCAAVVPVAVGAVLQHRDGSVAAEGSAGR